MTREAGSRALETLTNNYELECLKTGDRVLSPRPEKLASRPLGLIGSFFDCDR